MAKERRLATRDDKRAPSDFRISGLLKYHPTTIKYGELNMGDWIKLDLWVQLHKTQTQDTSQQPTNKEEGGGRGKGKKRGRGSKKERRRRTNSVHYISLVRETEEPDELRTSLHFIPIPHFEFP